MALLLGWLAAALPLPAQVPAPLPLPQNASPAGLEPLLLPEEILLAPPPALPPDAARQPSRQPLPPFQLQLAPVEIEPLLPPLVLETGGTLATAARVRVNGFRFEGNTVFSDRVLRALISKYAGREVTSVELEEARLALAAKYVEAGYITSGAVLPDQDLEGGILVFRIVEGRLREVELEGNWWFRSWWLRHELRRSAGRPLNFNRLKTGLQLLRQDPNIRQINAELAPAAEPGESILKTSIRENQPIRLGFEFSNKRPPSVGAEVLELHAADLNLTGHGDALALTWGFAHTTSETLERWEQSADENLAGSYDFPLTPWRTRLQLHAAKSDAGIIEEQFAELGIRSRSVQYGATLRQPFHESLRHLFAMALTADWRESRTFLSGLPFDLSPGALAGETRVFVARLSLEYSYRSQEEVLSARSTFNVGIDAFDATKHRGEEVIGEFRQKIPDGVFFSWLGQAQYIRRLFKTDTLAILRVNAQLANDPLVSLEQFSLGGTASVRGYRENQFLRDNGAFASLEVRVPLWRNKEKNAILSVAPFVDFGAGWDRIEYLGPQPEQIGDRYETLTSTGAGLILTPNKHVHAQLYWGYALNRKNVRRDGENLQDYGLHFSLSFNAF